MTLVNTGTAHMLPGEDRGPDRITGMRLLVLGFWHASEPGEDRPCVGRRWMRMHPHGENRSTYAN